MATSLRKSIVCFRKGVRQMSTSPSCLLEACYGMPRYMKVAPWPYLSHPYNSVYRYLGERTIDRFDENSKIISVEGNICSGKGDFQKQFAHDFGMLALPDVDPNDRFLQGSRFGRDVRRLKETTTLKKCHHFYSHEDFLNEKTPEDYETTRDLTYTVEHKWFQQRWWQYNRAFQHLMNTGQGVVVNSLPVRNLAFAEAYFKLGYMSNTSVQFFRLNYLHAILSHPKPHVIYYLDIPPEKCLQNFKKQYPQFANSPAMTLKLFELIDEFYKSDILPSYNDNCEIFVLSEEDLKDWDFIVDEAEKLNLEPEYPHILADRKFEEWAPMTVYDHGLATKYDAAHVDRFANMFRILINKKLYLLNTFHTDDYQNVYSRANHKYGVDTNFLSQSEANYMLENIPEPLIKTSLKETLFTLFRRRPVPVPPEMVGWDPITPLQKQWDDQEKGVSTPFLDRPITRKSVSM